MRERLYKYIGAHAYQVPMYTFHGFAEKLIREYPSNYEHIVGGRPANDIDKITILESIIDTAGIKRLRPAGDPSYYVTPIQRAIGELKKEYVSPDDFALLISKQESELLGIEQYHQKGAHKGKVRSEYTKKEEL